jgi:hypothetical protein
MSLSWVPYRVRQFFLALRVAVDPRDVEQARSILTPKQMELFVGMQPSEQTHAVKVYRRLVEQGETSPDLLVAALLHDVGKSLSPLHLWDRVLIVLAREVFPERSRRWGSLPAQGDGGWRRAFLVAEQHPTWGAALAAEAGASPQTVALIRQHQEPASTAVDVEIERLLSKLQAVDDHS